MIKEAKLIIEKQKRKLQNIRNLEYQEVSPPDTAYLEADATFITLQKKGKERGGKLEVKLGVGYTDKETRYKTGKSKRLKCCKMLWHNAINNDYTNRYICLYVPI